MKSLFFVDEIVIFANFNPHFSQLNSNFWCVNLDFSGFTPRFLGAFLSRLGLPGCVWYRGPEGNSPAAGAGTGVVAGGAACEVLENDR